ncbi:phage tail protein [Arthrobacter sp. H20]|uniref:phage tail protein n=1 Tax=Arthrobacter sp. H20 TaxID=1267981 RepID=UPI00047BD402|nr:phage tail protein [Arthrobacter sp. H20]
MTDYYPPWGFYYRVEFAGSLEPNEVRFQTVSGLSVEYDTEEYKEGGENRFTHKLPVRTKYSDLVLKRGMLTESDTVRWFLDAFSERTFQPRTVTVTLMNEKSEPLRTWNVAHAVPKKWTVSDFNSSENAIVVETLELTYQYFTIV